MILSVRGVAVSSEIIKTLQEREWIRVVGYRDVPGKPALFATTKQFLDYFNLKSLDDLPALGEIKDLTELDPALELSLAQGVPPSDKQDISESENLPQNESVVNSQSAGDNQNRPDEEMDDNLNNE